MHTQLEYLFEIEPPWVYIGSGEAERTRWIPNWFYSRPRLNVCVRRLRGQKMRTTQALMDEFGAALQFFEGFGENYNALDECLAYLDEWLPADAYVLVVERSDEVLADEPVNLGVFLKILNNAGEWWAKPITDNARFNRNAIPFHTLLHMPQDARYEEILQIAKKECIPVRR